MWFEVATVVTFELSILDEFITHNFIRNALDFV